MKTPLPSLSVVIPAYNEEKRILSTLHEMTNYFKNFSSEHEILVVNDGSTDQTEIIVTKFFKEKKIGRLLSYPKNRGKGFAVKTGMLEAKGEWVLFSDADNSTSIDQIETFAPYFFSGTDIVIGSRSIQNADVKIRQPFYREYLGKTFNKLVRLLVLRGFVDTQCGFKCFKKKCVKPIFSTQRLDSFCFDVEILRIAKNHHYIIKEVPIRWVNSPDSRVHCFQDPIKMFYDLLKIRFQTKKKEQINAKADNRLPLENPPFDNTQ